MLVFQIFTMKTSAQGLKVLVNYKRLIQTLYINTVVMLKLRNSTDHLQSRDCNLHRSGLLWLEDREREEDMTACDHYTDLDTYS